MKPVDTRLSYSSATLLSNCAQRYWHYKVNKTPRDPDSPADFEAFDLGKAFHEFLEKTAHSYPSDMELLYSNQGILDLVKRCCKDHNVEAKTPLIHAMVISYLELHRKTGLTCIRCEMEINNSIFLGFIDAIMKDDEGGWWIVDLKTAASVTDLKFAKLNADTQLNLYASFAPAIASYLGLDGQKFKGARYRVTTKSRASLRPKKGETYQDVVRRIKNSIASYDVIIPIEKMNPGAAYSTHKELHDYSMKIRSGSVPVLRNYSYCDSFFRPCEYFSQCHGSTVTNTIESMQVVKG